jgi:hypothetical protein
MRKLLLQLDSSPLPSVFDRVVAYDGGADEIMSYGGVTAAAVRDLVHGLMFTRGPKDLHHSAVWVGGASMPDGERLLDAVQAAFFGPLRVSVMLDSNGSNTTAVAAVRKLASTVDDVRGRRVLITAGTGPVGARAAGLFARAGADVTLTSRSHDEGERVVAHVRERFGGTVRAVTMRDPSQAAATLEGAELLLNAGPAGVMLVPRDAWAGRAGLVAAADLNAVPPLGIEGIDPMDNGTTRDGVHVFGAIGVGNYKMKVHKACVARLFTRTDLVLDAETIDDVAREMPPSRG